jgi:Uma2 family endonuclease
MIATAPTVSEERVVLQNVSWHFYESMLQELGENRSVRLTYDRGVLELMSPLMPHESGKCGIDRLVAVLAEELDLNFKSAGSLTCKREDLKRGAEPDVCYYIQNEPLIRHKEQICLPDDPPPDLVVEVEFSSSAVNKLELYAAMGVPEFWRFDGRELRVFTLEGGSYMQQDNSPTFVPISIVEIPRFLLEAKRIGEIPMVRQFRAWVQEKMIQR